MRCPLILIVHILETLDSKALGVFWSGGVEGSSHSSYLVHIVFFCILNFKKFLKATNSNIKTIITSNMVLKLLSSSLQG